MSHSAAKLFGRAEAFRNETRPRARADGVEVSVLRSLEEMLAAEDEWRGLEQRCETPFTFFQTYDWCARWVEVLGATEDSLDIAVYTVRVEGNLALVWPMMTRRGALGVRTLTMIGAPHTQYSNVLIDPAFDAEGLLGCCWAEMRADAGVDRVQLESIPDCRALARFLDGVATRAAVQNETSLLEFANFADWNTFQESLGSTMRRGRAKRRNKLAREGDVALVALWPGDDGFDQAVDDVVTYKRQWITETGRVSRGLSWENIEDFLRAMPGESERKQGLVVHALQLNDDNVAIELGFVWQGHYYCFLGGFDWAHRHLSPGKVQIEASMQWFLENGIRVYDFLPNPAEYKFGWTNKVVPVSSYSHAVTVRGQVFDLVAGSRARQTAKTIFYLLPKPARSLAKFVAGVRDQ